MGLMVIRHRVKDHAAWKKVFDGHEATRRSAGIINPRLYRSASDFTEIVILLDFAVLEKAKQFGNSPELKAKMAEAGVLDQPTVYLLDPA